MPLKGWRWLPAVAGVLVLAYRLFNLDLAPFIQDEPYFLNAARAQLQPSGHWVTASPIAGTQGFTYGPSPIWFYGVTQTLFGTSARANITAMCAFVTLAHLLLAIALTRAFKRGPLFFGLLAAFIGALPYQFMWSRLGWDQLVNATSGLIVALLAAERPFKPLRLVALGLVIGVALSSHLMVTMFVILCALVLLAEHVRAPRELGRLVGFAAPAVVLVNVPYLTFLLSRPLPAIAPSPWGAGPGFFTRLLEIPKVATFSGIEYFFDADWADFVSYAGFDASKLAPVMVAVVLLLTVAGLVLTVVFEQGGARRVAALGLTVLVGYPLFYAWKQLPLEPHYQFPTWWVIPVGIAGLVSWASRTPRFAAAAGGAVGAVVVLQLAFILIWVAYIRERGGTRGMHYSTPVEATAAAVRQACAGPEPTVYFANQTIVLPVVFQFHAEVEPLCVGKSLVQCGGGCPVGALGSRTFLFAYAKPRGGAAVLRAVLPAPGPAP
jgi:hypothetical protein